MLLFVSGARSGDLIVFVDLQRSFDVVLAAGTVRLVPLERVFHDLLRTFLFSLNDNAFAIAMVSVITPITALMKSTTAKMFADGTSSREGSGSMLLQRLGNLNHTMG